MMTRDWSWTLAERKHLQAPPGASKRHGEVSSSNHLEGGDTKVCCDIAGFGGEKAPFSGHTGRLLVVENQLGGALSDRPFVY